MRAGGPTDSDPQNQADLLTSWGGVVAGVWSLQRGCPMSLCQSMRVPAALRGHIQIWIIQRESIRR